MRKDNAYVKQRSIHSGYEKCHGLSSLAISLPTGIHCIYGLCSMRKSDLSMVSMSDIGNYLYEIQRGFFVDDIRRVTYGYKLFRLGRCIIRVHEGDLANPLTRQKELENSKMNGTHVSIEH